MTLRTSLVALAFLVGCAGEDADYDGWTVEAGDCDDNDNLVYPGGNELCDGIDNDCNNEIDDSLAGEFVFYVDADGDGYGATTLTQIACAAPAGFVENASDCRDEGEGAKDFNPRAEETCDGEDQNCNGEIDENAVDATAFHSDWDQDGYGSSTLEILACTAPEGYITDASDCNDFDPFANPAQDEVCDFVDNNCDGDVDEDAAIDAREWYADVDGDGYGDLESPRQACWLPDGFSAVSTDCNDAVGAVNPGAPEVCRDGLDNNCDDSANQCSFESWDSVDNATINWIGQNSSDYLGWDAQFVGDIDGDGMDDIVAGMPYADPSGSSSGTAFLVYGNDGYTPSADPLDITSHPGFNGSANYNYVGYAVGPAGDVDGDGYDDFLVGGRGGASSSQYYGNAVLIYGGATRLTGRDSMTSYGPDFAGTTRYDYFGGMVWGGSDINADGYDDFMIGAYGNSSYRGGVYVWTGSSTRLDSSYDKTDADAYWVGKGTYDYLGAYAGMGSGGDFDGDGNDDMLFSGYGARSYAGEGYLIYGDGSTPSGEQSLSGLPTFHGASSSNYFGYLIMSVGDPNADGYEDFGMGCYRCNSYGGSFNVYFGSSTQFTGDTSESDADVIINNTTQSSAYFGRDRGAYGDFNGDGIDDIAVGAYRQTSGNGSYNGAIWVLAGDAALGGEYEQEDIKEIAGPSGSYGYFGKSVSSGDFNGDGFADLIGGAYGNNSYRGNVYMFEGTSL